MGKEKGNRRGNPRNKLSKIKRKDHDVLGEDMYEDSEILERNRLNLSAAAGSMFDSSDDDIQSNQQLERALTLKTVDHTHDFDDDDDDDDDETFSRQKATKKKSSTKKSSNKSKKATVSSSSESEDDDDSDIDTSIWGTRKSDYYGADRYSKEVSSDDEPTQAADEEEEAKRLRKKQAMMLQASDFYEEAFDPSENAQSSDDDDDDAQDTSDSDEDAPSIFHQQKKIGSTKTVSNDDDDSDSSTVEEKQPVKKNQQKHAPLQPVLKEKVQKDLSALSTEERIAIVKKTSPELIQLLQEFSTNLESTMGVISPLLERVNNQDPSQRVCTDQGLSFLETKFHLMLSYCTNISFYLLLKLSGGSVKDHPVIDQLVRLRILIEKIRPLDAKLKYQIDKLIRLATLGPQTDQSRTSADPLSFRPEIDEVEEQESADEEDDASAKSGDRDVYRPPKISMKKFETERDKRKLKEDRESRRAGRSSMMKFIQEEFGDQPETVDASTGGALSKPAYAEESDASEEERTKFEEEYMVRLPVSRKLKKKRAEKIRQQTTLTHDLRELEDFGDIAGLTTSGRPSKPLGHVLNEIDHHSRPQSYSADADTISTHRDNHRVPQKRSFRPSSQSKHGPSNNNRQKKFRR